MRSNSCPKCQGSMTEGFIPGINEYNHRDVSTWIEGAPDRGLWGLKTRKKPKFEVQTFRCGRCGFLENYAKG